MTFSANIVATLRITRCSTHHCLRLNKAYATFATALAFVDDAEVWAGLLMRCFRSLYIYKKLNVSPLILRLRDLLIISLFYPLSEPEVRTLQRIHLHFTAQSKNLLLFRPTSGNHFSPDGNISTAVGRICIEVPTTVHGPQSMNPTLVTVRLEHHCLSECSVLSDLSCQLMDNLPRG